MEYIGKKRNYGYTTNIIIDGVYTVEDYYKLRDVIKTEMAKKKLAVFENMDIFVRAFNEIANPPTTPLNEVSTAWGLKIQELMFTGGKYIMEYNFEGDYDSEEIFPHNVFMFYTMKVLGTGKRKQSRSSRRRSSRRRKK